VESSKRLFPLASSGITLGFVVSGLFLKNTTQLIGVENTFLIGGFIIPATIYILNTLLKKHKVIYETKVETTTKIGETLNYIKNNNFYITVLIIGIIMPLIFFINDYLYNSMIKKSFIYEDKISSFFGLFYIVNGVISLFIRLFFISRIIIKLGVVRTTYLLILLFLSGILLMFSNSLISIFISKLLISIGLLTFGVSLFNLFYQVADLKYRSRVIVILETVGTSLGMLLGGLFTLLSEKELFSKEILTILAIFLLGTIFIVWITNYKGFFKILETNIHKFEFSNLKDLLGKNIPNSLKTFVITNLINGPVYTKLIAFDIFSTIDIENKMAIIVESYKNSSLSYKYKVLNYLFLNKVTLEDIERFVDSDDFESLSFIIYNIFLNYNYYKNNPSFKKVLYRISSYGNKDIFTQMILNFMNGESKENFLKILTYLFNTEDKINILKMLTSIKMNKNYYTTSKEYLISAYEKYFSDIDIMIKICEIISDFEDYETLNNFTRRFYSYKIINSFKINSNQADSFTKDNTFLSNLYALSIISKRESKSIGKIDYKIAYLSLTKLQLLNIEKHKIYKNFCSSKSKILIDELDEIRNTTLSIVINFFLFYHKILQVNDIEKILKTESKIDYIVDIVKNVIPREINTIIIDLILDVKFDNNDKFIYENLKIGMKNEFLYHIYQYLGDESMESELKDKLEKLIILKNIPLFQELNIDSLLLISQISEYINFKKGEIVVNEGEKSDSFFVVISGEVGVFKGKNEIAVLKSGAIFGEMGVIDETTRSATVITRTDTVFLKINGDNFIDLLKRYGSISLSIIKTISERLRNSLDHFKKG